MGLRVGGEREVLQNLSQILCVDFVQWSSGHHPYRPVQCDSPWAVCPTRVSYEVHTMNVSYERPLVVRNANAGCCHQSNRSSHQAWQHFHNSNLIKLCERISSMVRRGKLEMFVFWGERTQSSERSLGRRLWTFLIWIRNSAFSFKLAWRAVGHQQPDELRPAWWPQFALCFANPHWISHWIPR